MREWKMEKWKISASSLVSSSFWCCVLSSGPRCRHRRRTSASEWLSLSIFSEPTAWLTARRNCSRVYAWLSNLCIFMRLSFVRLTRFLARLMARPRVTLLASDTRSMVSIATWVASGKNYARKPRQPYFVWCFRVFFLIAFHTLSLLHFPLLHFPPLRYAPAFSTSAFSAPSYTRYYPVGFSLLESARWQHEVVYIV